MGRRSTIMQILRLRRPLSALTLASALCVIVLALGQLARGDRYVQPLDYVDVTTVAMVGILFAAGVVNLGAWSDLHAVAFSLIATVSFLFTYEALYKWSFYLAPMGRPMPPHELREFVVQAAIALTVLAGFAVGTFTVHRCTVIWGGSFVALWLLWLALGYPQITGETVFLPMLPGTVDHDAVYLLNRATKVTLFLVFCSLLPTRCSWRGTIAAARRRTARTR